MASRGNFIARVVQYVVNELLVDRLANNHSFQRFAVRSSRALEDLAQKGVQKKAELSEQLQEFSDTFTREFSKGFKDGPPPSKRWWGYSKESYTGIDDELSAIVYEDISSKDQTSNDVPMLVGHIDATVITLCRWTFLCVIT